MYLNFGIFTFLTPNARRKILWAALVDINHSSVSAVFPDRCWQLLTSPSRWTSEGNLSWVPAWYSEQNSLGSTFCTPRRPCSPSIQRIYIFWKTYLFRLLWTSIIITSVQGSGKNNVSLVSPILIYFHFNFLPN